MRCVFVESGRRGTGRGRAAALVAGLVLFAAGLASVAAEVRTWTDSRGRFKIQAKYVSQEDGKVTLEKTDGTEIEIELKKLSPADQKYVATLKDDDNPFKPAAPADPFKPKKKGAPAAADEPAAGAGPRMVAVDWSAARVVDAVPSSTQWNVTVGPPPAAPKLSGTKPIPIPPKSNFFEGTKGLVVNAASKRAVIGYNLDDPRPTGTTRLVLCDLENGKRLGVGAAPGKMVPVALHDDGVRVLMRRDEFGFGNADRLEIWSLTDSGIRKSVTFTPYDDLKGGDRDVRWAAFLDARRFATASSSGKLAVWDLATVKPLYSLKVQGSCIPGLSPDGKSIAFTTDKEVGILDVAAGEVVALQPKPRDFTPWPALTFSPSGKRLACSAFDRLFVWDTATGALYREIPYQGLGNVNSQPVWPDDDHVLLGNQTLIDLESQVRLWTYQGGEFVQSLGGLCWFVVSENPGALVPAKIPGPAVTAALQKALADPTFFVFKPGVTVVVDASGLSDPAQRARVQSVLAGKVQALGGKVGPGGTITLSATTEVGKEREVTYHMFGFGGNKTYKIREHFSRVRFLYQGQTAWEASALNIPGMVSLRQGQSMEDYLREHEKPNYAYFDGVELPKLLTRPSGGATLGTSRVTVAGIR